MAKKNMDPWEAGIKKLEFLERLIAVRKVYYAMSRDMGTQGYMIHANRQCLLDHKRQLTDEENAMVSKLMTLRPPSDDQEFAEQVLKMLERSIKKYKK